MSSVPTCREVADGERRFARLRWVVPRIPAIVQKAKPKQKLTSKPFGFCTLDRPATKHDSDASAAWTLCGRLMFFPKGLDDDVQNPDDILPSLGIDLRVSEERGDAANDTTGKDENQQVRYVRIETRCYALDDDSQPDTSARDLGYSLSSTHRAKVVLCATGAGCDSLGATTEAALAGEVFTVPVSGVLPYPAFAAIGARLIFEVDVELLPADDATSGGGGGGQPGADAFVDQLSTLHQTVASIVTRSRDSAGFENLPHDDPAETSPEWRQWFSWLSPRGAEIPTAWSQTGGSGGTSAWLLVIDSLCSLRPAFTVGASVVDDSTFAGGDHLWLPLTPVDRLSEPPQSLIREALRDLPALAATRHANISVAIRSERQYWYNFFWTIAQCREASRDAQLRWVLSAVCCGDREAADSVEALLAAVQHLTRPPELGISIATADVRRIAEQVRGVAQLLDATDERHKAAQHAETVSLLQSALRVWQAEAAHLGEFEATLAMRLAPLREKRGGDGSSGAFATPSSQFAFSPSSPAAGAFAPSPSSAANSTPVALAEQIAGELSRLLHALDHLEDARRHLQQS